jgi:hypothetical protein
MNVPMVAGMVAGLMVYQYMVFLNLTMFSFYNFRFTRKIMSNQKEYSM